MLYTISYVIVLGWISWEDIKGLRISIFSLMGVGFISFLEILSTDTGWMSLAIAMITYAGLWSLGCLVKHWTQSPALGSGDIWLVSMLTPIIYPESIPIFLMLTGILSLGWGLYWTRGNRKKRFPMVPSIGLAFLMVRLL